jgi:hypothetical protein
VAEHPNELVRDQYLVDIAERCGVDLVVLRSVRPGTRTRRDRRGAAVREDTRASAAPVRSADNPELHVLNLAVHQPETIPEYVDDRLFTDPIHQTAFDALVSAPSLAEAIADADPEVADLLQRVAVEEPTDDPEARIARLLHDAAVRELHRLTREARTSADPEAIRAIPELKLTIDEVRSSYWSLTEATRLLVWLGRDGATV